MLAYTPNMAVSTQQAPVWAWQSFGVLTKGEGGGGGGGNPGPSGGGEGCEGERLPGPPQRVAVPWAAACLRLRRPRRPQRVPAAGAQPGWADAPARPLLPARCMAAPLLSVRYKYSIAITSSSGTASGNVL